MIEILDSPKHLVAMRISGKISAEDISKAYRATEDALKDNERISFFMEIDDTIGLTLEGLAKDMIEGLGQITKFGRYYRAAVVTNQGWIAAITRAEGVLFCAIDMRVFSPDESDKAL